jgi:hypothetical protein
LRQCGYEAVSMCCNCCCFDLCLQAHTQHS